MERKGLISAYASSLVSIIVGKSEWWELDEGEDIHSLEPKDRCMHVHMLICWHVYVCADRVTCGMYKYEKPEVRTS